jgi:hypothetical protein
MKPKGKRPMGMPRTWWTDQVKIGMVRTFEAWMEVVVLRLWERQGWKFISCMTLTGEHECIQSTISHPISLRSTLILSQKDMGRARKLFLRPSQKDSSKTEISETACLVCE